jgi:hypothetical protein
MQANGTRDNRKYFSFNVGFGNRAIVEVNPIVHALKVPIGCPQIVGNKQ